MTLHVSPNMAKQVLDLHRFLSRSQAVTRRPDKNEMKSEIVIYQNV